jgi:hypothetical protein
MKEHNISTPQDLDAALSDNALRKHSQLWRVAEGRSFRWVDALGLVFAAFFLAISVVGFGRVADDPGILGVAVLFGLGAMLMVAMFVWGLMHRRVKALAELVKRLEQEAHEGRASA